MSPDSDFVVQVEGVTFTYLGEDQPSLKDVNLKIRRGSFVLVLGPSGSGKSSLINLLNGSIPHIFEGNMTGRVLVDGMDTGVIPVSKMATKVGLVFQDPDAQLVNVFVRDEIYFGPENLLMPVPEIEENAAVAVQMTGLSDILDREVIQLSGGQKQRVALASVLSVRPDLIALDQPTANLDPHTTAEVFRLLGRLNREYGITVVLVEQRVDDLVHLVDHVIVMEDGRIILSGPPRQVFDTGGAGERGLWVPQIAEIAHALSDLVPLPQLPLTLDELAPPLEAALAGRQADIVPPAVPSGPVGPPLIEVRGLTYRYRGVDFDSLTDVNLTIRAGEFLAIVGRNGSGKSTLAKTLTKINRAPNGKVFIGGQDINQIRLSDLTARMGYVFQNPDNQFVCDTVFDEIAYSLRIRNTPEEQVRARVQEVLKWFGLTGLETVSPFALSMGYRRLLSVATMLVLDQELIILDEPTIGQDYASCHRLMSFLRGLNEAGKTVVIITHDMRLISEWVGRVVVLSRSRVMFDGHAGGLFEDDQLLDEAALVRPPLAALARRLRPLVPDLPHPLLTVNVLRAAVTELLRSPAASREA